MTSGVVSGAGLEGEEDGAECVVVATRSGALAMRDKVTGELMHPIVGPLVEAQRLYVAPSRIEARLQDDDDDDPRPLVLLDVGLGAGSNAIAAWKVSARLGPSARRLEIVSFDRTAAAMELAVSAAHMHAASFGYDGDALGAGRALLANGVCETPRTSWRLVLGELPATLAPEPEVSADVVFWDPFSPRANPSLWTVAAFTALRRLCRPGATVHTYSAATATRSALLLAGFAVGAGSQASEPDEIRENKETTTAALSASDLLRPLDRRWLARLGRSSAPFPPDACDASAGALAWISALPQFS